MCLNFLQVKGANDTVNVRRLPKKKAPPRFGRKLTAAQKENATHICAGLPLCQFPPFFLHCSSGRKVLWDSSGLSLADLRTANLHDHLIHTRSA